MVFMMMGRGKNQIARKSPEPVGRDWSPEQRKIFAWFESGAGNLIVRARAGTGKTTTIIEGAQRAPETRILLAAFNKSIQKELEARIKSPNVEAKTLHGLGFSFLRRSWPKVRVSEHGEREQRLAMRACGRRAPEEAIRLVGQIHTKAREILALDATSDAIMDLMVDFNLMPDDELESEGCRAEWIARKAAEAIELAADRDILGEDSFEIDFADMIFLPLWHGMVRPTYDLVIVDEAQDMTSSQLQLAIQTCRKGGRIAIVGDDRQAIYGFRGADSKSLDRLKGILDASELGLTTTYRCPKRVVEIASRYVPDFRAADSAPEGIVERHTRDMMIESAGPSDFILSRTNAPLIKICLAILRQNKRAIVRGRDLGKGIKSLVSRQKASDLPALLGLLVEWKHREYKKASRLPEKKMAARLDYVDDQYAVVESLADDCDSLSDLKAKLDDLFSDNNVDNSVICSTVHKSKGLESSNVFLLEDTFFRRKPKDEDEQHEEENIMYVAVTRSKERLVYVSTGER
jgi:DNA helicase-2/ATP-dependent DNA helicase PcrA